MPGRYPSDTQYKIFLLKKLLRFLHRIKAVGADFNEIGHMLGSA
jgi:hypothetical protein